MTGDRAQWGKTLRANAETKADYGSGDSRLHEHKGTTDRKQGYANRDWHRHDKDVCAIGGRDC